MPEDVGDQDEIVRVIAHESGGDGSVPASGGADQPAAGRITVSQDNATTVLVRTFAENGTAAEQPFNVILAC